MGFEVADDEVDRSARLLGVGSAATPVVESICHVLQAHARVPFTVMRRRKCDEGTLGIERAIREGNEPLISTAVVPPEPRLRQHCGGTLEDAGEYGRVRRLLVRLVFVIIPVLEPPPEEIGGGELL